MPYPMIDDDENGENYKKLLIQQLNAPQPETAPGMTDNAFLSSLAQSASQLGTLGGKTADTSSVQRYADILDQRKQMQDSSNQAQMAKRQDILSKLAMMQDSKNLKTDQLAQVAAQKQADRDFDLQRDKAKYGYELSLANQKAKNAANLTADKSEAKPTVAQQAVDRNFAKDYNDYVAQGGFAEADKGLAKVRDVASQLRKDDSLTGAMAGMTPDWIRSFTNPHAIDVRENLEDVVQRSMRQIMGAQFTEAEGKRLLARAYNPSLPASVNAERVEKLADSLEQMAKAKSSAAHYYEQNGTLAGFQGSQANSIDQMLTDIDKIKPKVDNDVMAAEPPKGPAKPAMSTGPKPGDIVKGYQFGGGDPSDKNNWVKVK